MSLLGIDFTKSELAYVDKDVDRAGTSGLAVCGVWVQPWAVITCACELGEMQ